MNYLPYFPKAPEIKAIAFDLGNVLLPFSRVRAIYNLYRATGVFIFELIGYLLFSHVWQDFDTGHYTANEFYEKITKKLGIKIPEDKFRLAFADMFRENRLLIALLPELKKKFKLFLVSDINPIHYEFCMSRYPFLSIFEHHIVSYLVKARKPSPKVFGTLIDLAGTKPEEIMFVDDKTKNSNGAKKMGIQGVHFISELAFIWKLKMNGFLDETSPLSQEPSRGR